MYEGPDFRHLVSFVAVAEECNFGKAAKRLHISQPSLSKHIQQMEDGLRSKLFIRSHAGAMLTETGRQFLPFARHMLHMRSNAVRSTSPEHLGNELPLRFGYSPFADHKFVEEALLGYRELVPGGRIRPSSECSAELSAMVADGRLDAAIVSLPIAEKDLYAYRICDERLLVCLRRDDPLADTAALPQDVIAKRLCVMFARAHQPLLYDGLVRKLAKSGMELCPSQFVSSPVEMQFLVKSGYGFGLMPEGVAVGPELTLRSIEGVHLAITTAFICQLAQQRPVLPLLAYRIAQQCVETVKMEGRKRPNRRATGENLELFLKAG